MNKNEIAVHKIKAEMDGSKNNGYVKAVGTFLLQHLEENPDFAEHVLAQDKTIGKSLQAMRKIAEKQKVDNVAVLSDEDGFAIVVKYFAEAPAPAAPKPADKPAQEQKTAPEEPEESEESTAAEETAADDEFDFLL